MQYATAKKCGVCHKEYSKVDFKVNGMPFEHVVLRTPIRTTIEEINLCPDCARNVFHLLCKES